MWRMVVRGDAGQTQIDMNYKNHQLIQSGAIPVSSFTTIGFSEVDIYEMTITGLTAPMLAVRTEGTASYSTHYSAALGQYTFRIVRGRTGSAPVEWWLFDVAAPGQGAASGNNMVIRNPATGEIVFDLARKPLRIADFIQQVGSATGINVDPAQDFTYVLGRKYAAITCRSGGFDDSVFTGVGPDPARADFSFEGACQGIPNGVRLTMVNTYFRSVNGSSPPPWSTPYQSRYSDWLVVDVTHY